MPYRNTTSFIRPAEEKWSRLKPVAIDPLEAIGLPSKGDTRLLDHKVQEDYFQKLSSRYRKLQKSSSAPDGVLTQSVASLSLNDESDGIVEEFEPIDPIKSPLVRLSESREHSVLVEGMRKLREAVVATGRKDKFALDLYAFIIHATIISGHMESYHPALLYLLRNLIPSVHDGETDTQKYVGYYVLDVACRQDNLGKAFDIKHEYSLHDQHIESLLKALAQGNWILYWKAYQHMDVYERRLVQASHEKMRKHTLGCFAATYLSVEKGYLEGSVQQPWLKISEVSQRNWQLEEQTVVIRRIRKK